jgi:hypothetical protein
MRLSVATRCTSRPPLPRDATARRRTRACAVGLQGRRGASARISSAAWPTPPPVVSDLHGVGLAWILVRHPRQGTGKVYGERCLGRYFYCGYLWRDPLLQDLLPDPWSYWCARLEVRSQIPLVPRMKLGQRLGLIAVAATGPPRLHRRRQRAAPLHRQGCPAGQRARHQRARQEGQEECREHRGRARRDGVRYEHGHTGTQEESECICLGFSGWVVIVERDGGQRRCVGLGGHGPRQGLAYTSPLCRNARLLLVSRDWVDGGAPNRGYT